MKLLLTLAVGLLLGCSSARISDREPDRLFRERRFEEAAEKLRVGLKKQEGGRDELLYLLDLGLCLNHSGKYEESIEFLLKADKMAEIKDYTSLTEESATLLVSDNTKPYKGEDFEKVLINTYLAINFAMSGKAEDAIVEARRVNRKLLLMVTEGKRKYKQNAFARYLSGLLYEDEGEFNEAYIEYKYIADFAPETPGLGLDLWRTAALSGMDDEAEKWGRQFGLTRAQKKEAARLFPKAGLGELVVIYQNGISPIKVPHPSFHSVPKFVARTNPVTQAEVRVYKEASSELALEGPEKSQVAQTLTRVLHDVESTAIENLDEKYAGIIAKKLAGVVVKEVVGNQVGQASGNDALGAITKILLYAADQADLRSWSLLPKDFQIGRLVLEPGRYRVKVEPVGGGVVLDEVVEIKRGRKVFLNTRFVP